MVFRSDILVDWTQSPRLVFVSAPSTELIIQDLYDTLRRLEERPWEGISYPQIIEIAGKEELGGEVTVGLTAKLLNARLAFEARKTSTVFGMITTTDNTGQILTDSSATFITAGIESGAWVINLTDQSKATVLKVISQTQILTDILGDGADNKFEINDQYKIQNITQCEVSGGNLVAVDSNNNSISAILPTTGTQIVKTSSSSATLQELQDIQFSSFSGGITININSQYSGTEYPVGTPRQPVNNMTDAIQIANNRGLINFYIQGSITLGDGIDIRGKIIIGECTHLTMVTIESGALVEDTEFQNLTINGVLDGHTRIRHSIVGSISNVHGVIEYSLLKGTIIISDTIDIWNCADGVPGSDTPIIDCGGAGASVNIRNYNGGLQFQNKTGTEDVSIDCNSARIVLDNTVSNGAFIIRGVGKLINNSTGSTTVDSEYLVSPVSVSDAVWDESSSQHLTVGSMGEAITNAGLTPEQAKQLLIVFINSL